DAAEAGAGRGFASEGPWLVAMDFSEPARAALKLASRWAAKFGAELVVAHIVDPLPTPKDAGEGSQSWTRALREHGVREAEERLALEVARDAPEARVVRRVGFGSAAEELAAMGQELGASLLVVGTHGRTGLPRLFLGSTAERCLQEAQRPVLVVPS